jgi:CHAD domain-containing protein
VSTASTEVELKYRVLDPDVGARLLASDTLGPFVAQGPARTTQTEDHYVDTPDTALTRAGFAGRFRQSGGTTLISLKSLHRSSGSIHRRDELEGPADRSLSPIDWPSSPARSLVLELCGDGPLVELVTVRQLRRKRRYASSTTEVELSVDEADVVDRGRIADHFTELEIEVMSGDPGPLEALAPVFDAEPGLRPSPASKLEAALSAAGIPLLGRPAAGPGGGVRGNNGPGRVKDPAQEPAPEPPTGVEPAGATPIEASAAVESKRSSADQSAATDETVAAASVDADAAAGVVPSPTPPATGTEPATGEPATDAPRPGGRRAARGSESAAVAAAGAAGGRPRVRPRPAFPPLEVPKTPGVQADDTLAEAGRRVLRFHLARMLAKEEGTRAGTNAEDLHGMRVATRRMRAAWRVFGSAFRPARTRRYRRDLRYVAARLGAVRDLDVLLEGLEHYRKRLPNDTDGLAIQPLADAWARRRDEARAQLATTLDSGPYRRFVEEYREFVLTDGTAVMPVSPTEPHRVRDSMPSRIWAAYEHVRAYEPVLRWADVETLHELRIAAKWLRYTIEFVREPLGSDATPLIERVVALQDHLGWLHDADVAAGLARSFLVEHAADLDDRQTAAIARYLMDRERERQRLRRSVGTPWRRVSGLAFRRSLARVLADL